MTMEMDHYIIDDENEDICEKINLILIQIKYLAIINYNDILSHLGPFDICV